MSEQIGWLCYTDNGCRHFIWKADDADEQAWLDKHYPRREPVYTRITPEARYGEGPGSTHWEGCWRSHHGCAVAKLEALLCEPQRDESK